MPRSAPCNSSAGIPDRSAMSGQSISCDMGPEVAPNLRSARRLGVDERRRAGKSFSTWLRAYQGDAMNGTDDADTEKWDPVFTRQVKNAVGPAVKRYFRAEVNGLQSLPASGGALVVSMHSGGVLTPDVLIFAPAFYDAFGYDRPLYILAHTGVLLGPLGTLFSRVGGIEASRDNAAKALRSGGVVLVFPGGDYDAFRPTRTANTIDFQGR